MGFVEYRLLIAYTQESVKSIPPHERRQLLLGHALCSHKHPHRWEIRNTALRLCNSSTRGKSSLNATLSSLSPTSHLVFSFCNLSYCPLSITVVCLPIHFHCDPMLRKHSSRPLPILLLPLLRLPMTLLSRGWVADEPPKIINQRRRRMAESRGPIKRRIVNNIGRTSLVLDTKRTSGRP
jgi:hypothetical protein